MQKKESTTELYQEKVNCVIDYVYAHIGEDISLARLAEVSGFSVYHIHRILRAFLGGSIGAFIVRSRAEKAANLLRSTAMSIAEIVWRELLACALKYRFITFGVSLLGLFSITAIICIAHFNSDTYGGGQFNKAYSSPYLSEKGSKTMQRKYHTVAILPSEYHDNPLKAKEQLKRTKAILKKREREM